MRRTERLVALCAVAAVAACGGSSSSSDGGGGGAIQTAVQGSWSRCDGGGGASEKVTVTISGSGFTQTGHTYATDDCTGAATLVFTDTGSFTVGAARTTTLGGASVTAYEFNVTSNTFGTFYDLAYVDTAATPDRFYTGDVSGANDGSTPALRPTALAVDLFLSSGTGGGGGGGVSIQTALQGTWSRCDADVGSSNRTTLAISGSGYTQTAHTYATTNCTGAATLVLTDTGTFAVGAAVTKTVGGASVTAYELDVTSNTFGTFYDLAYVDTAATPDRFYTGDTSGAFDGSTLALRPTALDEAFALTKQ